MNISHFLQKITQQIRSSNRCSLSTIQPVRPFIARLLSRTNYSPIFYITASEEIKRKVFRQIESLSFLNQDGMMAIGVDFEEKYSGIVLQKTLREKKNLVIVLNVNELDQEVVELENFMSLSVLLEKGKEYQRDQLIDQFYRMGYERKDFVREKGDIAIRGEVVDVYPPDGIEPIRTYWWGNLLEKMKYFQADTQRTDHDLEHALVIPSDGEFKTVPLIKLIMEQAHLIFWDDVFIENTHLSHIPQVITGIVSRGDLPEMVITASRPPSFFGEIPKLIDELKENNWGKTYLIFPSEKIELFAAILDEEKIPYARYIKKPSQIFLLKGFPAEGFMLPDLGFSVFTTQEIFGKDFTKPSKKRAESPIEEEMVSSLQPGDYIVHEEQGIGIFKGIKEMVLEGVHRVYLVIEYAAGDILYVPVESASLVQKYIGSGDVKPKISRLGKDEWGKAKQRVAQSIQETAQELLEIYALRNLEQGHAFSLNSTWHKQLELSFPYIETPDQKQAIIDVERDMESTRPMDRLICGDVGYGKTEIAIRAAFKAVMDGKQVALLAPTTILSEQHYLTFKERLKRFPVRIAVINRFKSMLEQKQIVEGIKNNEIDILIGTHRLIQKDIQFHDLGLVIIDEEQRFGVMHKERLKKMKSTVDVLTLTATPIPRTLYLSLTGIRDISVIETPPEGRKPVHTVVASRSQKMIKEAIQYELERKGQVFYVSPRIKSLMKIYEELVLLFPECQIGIAHGRLSGPDLEKVMEKFYNAEIDILLCTTIIEIGLDVPNANTLIVDPATLFGLSQLYQLRGRIGRFDREAYAYLFYPKRLTHEAQERLDALLEFEGLGTGYKLALRDMEIRGAGNILGQAQHGFIQEIGFSLYTRMLQEEISRLKGENTETNPQTTIVLQENAFFPNWYMKQENERFSYYQRLLQAQKLNDIEDLRAEIEDRYGRLPREVETLLKITTLRYYGKIAQVDTIEEKNGEIYIGAPIEVLVSLNEKFRNHGVKGLLVNYHGKQTLRIPFQKLNSLLRLFDPMVGKG
jgi:transcription-repair coupling factor (superfamily II helicase)